MVLLLFGSIASNLRIDDGFIEILFLLWSDFIDGVVGRFGGWGGGLVFGLLFGLVLVDLLMGGFGFGLVRKVRMSVLVDFILMVLSDGFGVVLNETLVLFGFGLDDVL